MMERIEGAGRQRVPAGGKGRFGGGRGNASAFNRFDRSVMSDASLLRGPVLVSNED